MSLRFFLFSVAFVVLCAPLYATSSSSTGTPSSYFDDEAHIFAATSTFSPSLRTKRERYEEGADVANFKQKWARSFGEDETSSARFAGEMHFQNALNFIDKKRYPYALQQLKFADGHGHPGAQALLSSIYLDQALVEKYDPLNEDNASRSAQLTQHYLESAAKNRHMPSLRTLWEDVMPERGDLSGEIKWAARAARLGDKFALKQLTKILLEEKDRAVQSQVRHKLGSLYYHGTCVVKNVAEGLDFIAQAAMFNNPKSIVFLMQNLHKAEDFAMQGRVNLLYFLAHINAGRNERKAYNFARRAATLSEVKESSFSEACKRLQYGVLMRTLERNGCPLTLLRRITLESFVNLASTPDYDTLVRHARERWLLPFWG